MAINKNANAPIFKNCDYGIVGDVMEILPLLTAALDNGEAKKPAPPMVKMKRPLPPKPAPIGKIYTCGGCGYEYNPAVGDADADIARGPYLKSCRKTGFVRNVRKVKICLCRLRPEGGNRNVLCQKCNGRFILGGCQ